VPANPESLPMPSVGMYSSYVCVFSSILTTNMWTYVRVLVEYALYYKQLERTLLVIDIDGHCFSTSGDRMPTFGRTLENDGLETNRINSSVEKNNFH
jgi:hypothetical protein